MRTSHYPQSRHFIDRCDELGLLVFTEIPGWQHIGGNGWKDIAVQNTREMVLQYRNHPSVILWGVRINESPDDDAFYRRTNAAAHELDPTRQTGGVRCYKKGSLLEDVYTYNDFFHDGTNAGDQKNAELMAPVYKNIPKDIPVIGTHVWPAQAALHAGMQHVVNAIPDNWPMALHLAEGSIHTIQTQQSYMGYRILNGMQGSDVLKPMPADSLVYTGHYIDHEFVANLEADCDARVARKKDGKPMRFLLTIGGAGAQRELFAAVIKHLLPLIREKKAALYVNVGDYKKVWEQLCKSIKELKDLSTTHFGDWNDTNSFAQAAIDGDVEGVHAFWHENIFEAVYCTNLLMRSADVLVTKPSELAFYPIPKLFLKRIGGHEKWGAIHSAEMGDGTLECEDVPHTLQMLDMFLNESELFGQMCERIKINKTIGLYDGAYNAVKIAMGMKEK